MKNKNIFYFDKLKESTFPVLEPPDSPAKLTFMIADLKLTNDGQIKILEFGNGMKAVYNGYNQFSEQRMLDHFWKFLTNNLNMPVFYVKPLALEDDPRIMQNVAGQYNLHSLQNNYQGILGDLTLLDYYQQIGAWGAKHSHFNPDNIFSYSGVLITDHLVTMDDTSKQEISARYPHLLHLNSTSDFNFIISNKIMSNSLFNEGLQQYRPRWLVRDKYYSPYKAREIINSLESEQIIIKPIDSCRGNGVILCNCDDLDDKLQMISEFYQYRRNIGQNKYRYIGADEYWRYDDNPYFLIEQYIPSVKIGIGDDQYDPTMRIVFAMQYYDDFIKIDYFDAYWKLPAEPVNSGEITSTSVVSKIDKDKQSSLPVSNEHKQQAVDQLKKVLPEVYLKLLKNGAIGLSRYLVGDDRHQNEYNAQILEKFGITLRQTIP